MEDFFRKPDRAGLRLSPNGRSLAWLAPFQRRLNVHVQDLESGDVVRVTEAVDRDVAGYYWVDEDRIVYAQDTGGDENYHLFAVGHDGSNPLDLTPFDGVKCSLVDDLEDVEGEVLMQMNQRRKDLFDVYRLNVISGELTAVAENPGNVQGWLTDHDGRLRAAVTTDGVNTSILYREQESDDWNEVATFNFKECITPLRFTFDNRNLYVASNVGRDKQAIFEYDPRTAQLGELLFEHDEVDVSQLITSRHRKIVTGVAFEVDRLTFQFVDEERRELQEFLDRERPDHENMISSSSRDESRMVVYSGSDRGRGSYYLVDRADRANPTMRHLFDLSPWLQESEMARLQPIQYRSRDGLNVRGYLTLPVGHEGGPLPMVVNPHGGPWARDSFGFNPEVQFLANRGYAVLQMNFRGSAGFGREFLEASFGQWGLTMQDDITDGVQWAIDQGIADPKRVAIYGASYGGYATLSGVTRTPDLYRCAISYVGVSNLFTWIEAIPPYWTPYLEMMYEMVGHPERDKQRFEETSPLFHADRIQVPLFVAQGANDPRVTKEESDQIVEALRQRGLPVEYMVKENEGHGFHNEENAFDFYRAMESFLAQHL